MACDNEVLIRLATQFRKALLACETDSLFRTLQDFPHGACGDASYLLAKYLEEKGCGKFDHVLGESGPDSHSHTWLEKDGVIVDITADQFEGMESEVLVTRDKSWHLQFEEEDRHVADFERFDRKTVSNLTECYRKVFDKIEM